MEDADILPFERTAWDVKSAERRIAQLEMALMRRVDQIEQLQQNLNEIKTSSAWKAVRWFYKIREKMLPLQSRRRRFVRTLVRASGRGVGRVVHSLTGRNLADPDGGERDTVALDLLQYRAWMKRHEPTAADLDRQRKTSWGRRPRISLIVPTYNTPAAYLEEMITSVCGQTYANWELCIADGASTDGSVRERLAAWAARDTRVRIDLLVENRGIAGNTNAALALATGDFVAFLDHDDTLAPFALHEVAQTINDHPDADFIYSDEDKLDESGRRVDPSFKPDWSPDLLRGHNYICHLLVLRRNLVERLQGIRSGFDGAQDYDLVFRASEVARQIVHIPKVLYHWRMHPQSTAASTASKRYAHDAGKRALIEHLARSRNTASVNDGPISGTYRVNYQLPRQPLVSILIPNRDSVQMISRCIESLARSSYANYEVLILENHSADAETLCYYRQVSRNGPVRIVSWDRPFNYAAINNFGAAHARGELLLFLNNDVEAIDDRWLERMVAHAVRPEVGAVGAKLLYADDTIQHAGIVIGMGGVAGHAYMRFPRAAEGYMGRLRLTHNCSAVTGACLMTRREVFDRVGGFDEGFVLAFNDVDLCLQIRSLGYQILLEPEAELYHLESKTRGLEDTPEKLERFRREFVLFEAKWGACLEAGDPFYNPNFRLDRADFCLRA